MKTPSCPGSPRRVGRPQSFVLPFTDPGVIDDHLMASRPSSCRNRTYNVGSAAWAAGVGCARSERRTRDGRIVCIRQSARTRRWDTIGLASEGQSGVPNTVVFPQRAAVRNALAVLTTLTKNAEVALSSPEKPLGDKMRIVWRPSAALLNGSDVIVSAVVNGKE